VSRVVVEEETGWFMGCLGYLDDFTHGYGTNRADLNLFSSQSSNIPSQLIVFHRAPHYYDLLPCQQVVAWRLGERALRPPP
jgi:hypothetical protein